jgi:hypothetical protein
VRRIRDEIGSEMTDEEFQRIWKVDPRVREEIGISRESFRWMGKSLWKKAFHAKLCR